MAIITNSSTSYNIKASGVEEDVLDIKDFITDISPTETPFLTGAGSRDVSNTTFDWMVDSLSAVDTTPTIEGETITAAAASLSTRKTNIVQIMHRAVAVTGTQSRMKLHGGKNSQMAYQMTRRTKELKRSLESALLSNQARKDDDSSSPRTSAMILSWMDTNTAFSVSGTTNGADPTGPGGTGAGGIRTDASANGQRALTAALVNTTMQSIYENGGEADTLMVGPFNKTKVSGFSGRTDARQMVDANKVGANITVFLSDFGDLTVKTNRFQRERDCFLLDFSYWNVAYLRNFQVHTMGRKGDAEEKYVIVEAGLESLQEAASGLIADCTTS